MQKTKLYYEDEMAAPFNVTDAMVLCGVNNAKLFNGATQHARSRSMEQIVSYDYTVPAIYFSRTSFPPPDAFLYF